MDWKELMYSAFAEQGGVDPRDFVQQQAAERQAQAPLDGDGRAEEGLDVEIHYYAVHVDEETTRTAQSVGELRQALAAGHVLLTSDVVRSSPFLLLHVLSRVEADSFLLCRS